ncbi:hypothetical protein L873DRAFT_1789644 [Choiromyces venosus 120613-1]|uniref:Uncharacterized protein n=1 Tax=Choiromyces venosus 120613-1 TaxID=1336337 RepID=A0A3N4JRN7_9PEZI|nr:hypothetical protein L873DRAFT_1789644 [Choiromyces venosus 120613-1]
MLLHALKERKFGTYQEEFKPILTLENKKVHLKYCEEREYWLPAGQWADYAFTDEMSMEVGACFGVNLVWREKGEHWPEDYKGPFHIWAKEMKEEKAEAKKGVEEWNKRAERKEDQLITEWSGTEEWWVLKEVELEALRASRGLRAAAKERGEKFIVPQLWWAKRF